jgi:hypothetical protein
MASSGFQTVNGRGALPSTPLVPQHFLPPTPRELRAQAVHRLQVGLFGLAGMVLLVGLANIIMDRARVNDDATAEAAAASATVAKVSPETAPQNPASDPLADMGVVPDLPAAGEGSPAPAGSVDPTPAVTP